MSDAETCLSSLCGGCCIALTTAIGVWCNTNAVGANIKCCGLQGCCGGCCKDSFDEDNFDEQARKEMERTKDASQPVKNQPGPSTSMTANTTEGASGALKNASPAHNQNYDSDSDSDMLCTTT